MSAVFGDAFYFLGLISRDDHAHSRCVAFSKHYRGHIITTSWILIEGGDALAKPPHRDRAIRFFDWLPSQPRVRVTPATETLVRRGLDRYKSRRDKEWSLTDCISFVVMGDEGITEALTGDHDFEQAGFTILLK